MIYKSYIELFFTTRFTIKYFNNFLIWSYITSSCSANIKLFSSYNVSINKSGYKIVAIFYINIISGIYSFTVSINIFLYLFTFCKWVY